MQARDAAGRQVSLLNDDSNGASPSMPHRPLSFQSTSSIFSHPSPASRSSSSSPHIPELLRSDSYDSQTSTEPISPMTPSMDYPFPRTSIYHGGQDYQMEAPLPKRPAYAHSSRAPSFADEDVTPITPTERPGKRYPCRYRDSHGCEKTFTTSGHASRHSKIHTAEKAVQCTYPGCQKKFTRADNMKQHLETHYKDKSRSSSSQRAHKTAIVEARRSSASSRSRSATLRDPATTTTWETTAQYPLPTTPLATPNHAASKWEPRELNLPLLGRPSTSRTPSSGLDALAMAVACQEGAAR